jgi:hypothetical protein
MTHRIRKSLFGHWRIERFHLNHGPLAPDDGVWRWVATFRDRDDAKRYVMEAA